MNYLLDDMSHWDKDKRFMAASDLSNEISQRNEKMEIPLQRIKNCFNVEVLLLWSSR